MNPCEVTAQALCDRFKGTVVSVARRIERGNPDITWEDLLQSGSQGVLEARHRYCEDKRPLPKTPFENAVWSYISKEIRKACRRGRRLNDSDQVRHECSLELMEDYFNEPALHDPIAGMAELLGAAHSARIVEKAAEIEELPGDDVAQELENREVARKVRAAVAHLGGMYREVVDGMYFRDRTLDQLAVELGRDAKHLSKVHRAALRRLKAHLISIGSGRRRTGS